MAYFSKRFAVTALWHCRVCCKLYWTFCTLEAIQSVLLSTERERERKRGRFADSGLPVSRTKGLINQPVQLAKQLTKVTRNVPTQRQNSISAARQPLKFPLRNFRLDLRTFRSFLWANKHSRDTGINRTMGGLPVKKGVFRRVLSRIVKRGES